MSDLVLTVLGMVGAYYYGAHRRDRRARNVFFSGLQIVSHRQCRACGLLIPGSALDRQAHSLQHTTTP